jgi:ribosome biogenesis GTPase / thiamine phosphate phosphatase
VLLFARMMLLPSRSAPPGPPALSHPVGDEPGFSPCPASEGGLLTGYGWDEYFEEASGGSGSEGRIPGRVSAEHRGEYSVITASGELRAEIAGRLRLGIQRGEEDRPAVGDWVLLSASPDADRAIIHLVLPRRTKLSRKAAGREDVEQVIAANVDVVFIVSSLDHDLNERRLERYLSVVGESGARPVVVLTKTDLCNDWDQAQRLVQRVAPGVEVHAVSALTGEGLVALEGVLAPGLTVALVGS